MRRVSWLCLALWIAGCAGATDESASVPPADETTAGVPAGAASNDVPVPFEAPVGSEPEAAEAFPDSAAFPDATAAPEPVGAAPPEFGPALDGPRMTTRSLPAAPQAAPSAPMPSPPPVATEGHVVRIFYATDRAPLDAEEITVGWRHYLPTFAGGGLTLLAALALTFLPKKVISAAVTGGALAATLYLGQHAVVRA